MEIRRATPADAKAIAAAEGEIFSDGWDERAVTDAISATGAMCYVATRGGTLLAYVIGRVIIPEGEIYRIATLPAYRKRGIAYRLLDYAYKTEQGHGLEVLFLEVRTKNSAARALYRTYGFKEISIRKNYYRDPPDDAVIMLKAHPDDLKN